MNLKYQWLRWDSNPQPSSFHFYALPTGLALFDMGFFEPSWRRAWGPRHNFVVIALMIMKFGTGAKLYVFYTMVTKIVTSILLRNDDLITYILVDA